MLDYGSDPDTVLSWSTGRISVLWRRRLDRIGREHGYREGGPAASTASTRTSTASTKQITMADMDRQLKVKAKPYPFLKKKQ